VALGSTLSIFAILLIYRFQNFSRAVFILDAILLLFLLIGSRLAFRLIRYALPKPMVTDGRRVLIYGAGDGGELVLREIRNNPSLKYQPVAFIDDDPLKKGKTIGGLNVLDANGRLERICREKNIQEILVSTNKIPKETLEKVRDICRQYEISLKRAYLKFEPMEFE
jgi:UDP-GlcNAc:undecaprenyl-phosphate GlcNAc-1-phosphate transferase